MIKSITRSSRLHFASIGCSSQLSRQLMHFACTNFSWKILSINSLYVILTDTLVEFISFFVSLIARARIGFFHVKAKIFTKISSFFTLVHICEREGKHTIFFLHLEPVSLFFLMYNNHEFVSYLVFCTT